MQGDDHWVWVFARVFRMCGVSERKGTLPIIFLVAVVRLCQPPPCHASYANVYFSFVHLLKPGFYATTSHCCVLCIRIIFFTLHFVVVICAQSEHAAKLNPSLEERKRSKWNAEKKMLFFRLCVCERLWMPRRGIGHIGPVFLNLEICSTHRSSRIHFHITKSNGHRWHSVQPTHSLSNDGNHSLQINGNFTLSLIPKR